MANPPDLHEACWRSATDQDYPSVRLDLTRRQTIGHGPPAWRTFLNGATIFEAAEALLELDDVPDCRSVSSEAGVG